MIPIHSRLRRLVLRMAMVLAGLLSPLLAGAGTASALSSSAASGDAPPPPAIVSGTLVRSGVVDLHHLATSARGSHPAHARPLHANHSGAAAPRTGGVVSAPPENLQTVTESVVTKFAGMTEDQQSNLFGLDQELEPPDVQVAAGPSNVVEMVNSTISIWSKTGTLGPSGDLNSFFIVPSGYSFSDPRVVYDPTSNRWFADGLSFDAFNDSQTYLAVSQTADPAGVWTIYTLKTATNNIYDQPFLGFNDDKVIVTWNDYPGGVNFGGAETVVLQKADLVSMASTVHTTFLGPDVNRFRLVPAVQRSANTTEYMVYSLQVGSQSKLGVVAVTGTPTLNNVTLTETDLNIAPLAANVPPPIQPGGTITSAIDNRFLGAVWQNGTLWTSGNDSCTPSGDSTARTCGRYLQVSTAGASPTLLQDFDLGASGTAIYYPAVAMDSAGNMATVYTQSSATEDPTVLDSGQAAGTTGSLLPSIVVQAGGAAYNGTRWGDYHGAAVDAADGTKIWLNGEFADASTTGLPNWATEISEVTFATSGTIGGKNLRLTRETSGAIGLSWQTGTVQAGYAVLRFTSTGQSDLTPTPLAASATSFTDASPVSPFSCYVLVPLNSAGAAIGQSDLLCYLAGYQSASDSPTNFSIELDQSTTAHFTWGAPSVEFGYVLYGFPNGGAVTQTMLPSTATSATNPNTVQSCYILGAIAQGGTTLAGNTDGLCAIPGFATVHPASPTSLSQVQAQTGARVHQLRQTLHPAHG